MLVVFIDLFGFRINFGAGKTEALVRFAGTNASMFKQKLISAGSIIRLPAEALPFAGGATELRVVPYYKHLGSNLSVDGRCNSDVALRCSSAMAA